MKALVEALVEAAMVVIAVSSALGETVDFLTHVIKRITRRAADHRRASDSRAARAKRQAAIERLKGGVSLTVVLGTRAVRGQVVRPSVRECVAQVGRLGHEDRHGHQVAAVELAVAATTDSSDALAADLPPAIRSWAAREAALVRESHADNGALRAEVAAQRYVHAALRAPDGPAVVTLLTSMDTLSSTDDVERADAVAFQCAPEYHFVGTSREVSKRLLRLRACATIGSCMARTRPSRRYLYLSLYVIMRFEAVMLTRARIQIGLGASSLESGHRHSTRRPPRTASGIAVAGCSATVMLTLAVSRLAALPLLVRLSGTVVVTRTMSLLEALPLLVWLSVTVIVTRTVSRLAAVPHLVWMSASTASARVIVPQAKTLLALKEAFWTV